MSYFPIPGHSKVITQEQGIIENTSEQLNAGIPVGVHLSDKDKGWEGGIPLKFHEKIQSGEISLEEANEKFCDHPGGVSSQSSDASANK